MRIMPLIRLMASLFMIVAPPLVYFIIVRPSLAHSNDPESVDVFAKVLGGILMLLGIITAPIWFAALLRADQPAK
jgi:hypothetical protein